MKKTIFFCAIMIASGFVNAQSGCTDPQATNFDINAVANDGTCEYEPTLYTMEQRAELPETLNECSGIAFFDGQLWGHNDSYMPNYIHQVDTTTGAILRSVLVSNYENEDWEDFADSDTYLFLGDFGNNFGTRNNLSIGRIKKSDLTADSVTVDSIHFTYEDQTDFTENYNNHNFDCEAFFYLNDSLHLFTKNWADNRTKYYVLPATPGDHIARLVGEFDVECLVSSVDIQEDGIITLLGYTEQGEVIMWLLFDYDDDQFFSGNKRKIYLGTGLTNSVAEGIAFSEGGRGFVGSEAISIFPARILSFSINQWVENYITSTDEFNGTGQIVYPNPFDDRLIVDHDEMIQKVTIFSLEGKKYIEENLGSQSNLTIDVSALPLGMYVVQISSNKGVFTELIQKQ